MIKPKQPEGLASTIVCLEKRGLAEAVDAGRMAILTERGRKVLTVQEKEK